MLTEQTNLASGYAVSAVVDGHLEHARLANRMFYRLRRSSPTWLAHNDPQIRVLMKYPGQRPQGRKFVTFCACSSSFSALLTSNLPASSTLSVFTTPSTTSIE